MAVASGSIRFNTDSSKLEIYNGDKWWNIDSTSPEEQTGGTRALSMGGSDPGVTDTIQYVNISTTGNAIDFGNLTQARYELSSVGSRTRGIAGGGYVSPSDRNTVDYVEFATTGHAVAFGNLVANCSELSSFNNSTRGIWAGGKPSGTDTINI